ncbi:MAG TPA: heparan-alpha-glucosaminide N-acetyltransferase domain-containing protein [Pseudolabrys sp.]|nr:heparan-alpha-glucosaminide N-acetyltransferase domain-containing protein [Pseudolabrys sp.]
MHYPDVPVSLQTHRVVSVDALRGFSMFWIIGGDGATWALARMLRDKGPVLHSIGSFLATQMNHADWEGFRFYDFIFPLFIFVTGVAIVLALPRTVQREGKWKAHLRVFRRALLLYVLGVLFYGGVGHQWSDLRLVGVLQRIAICYLFASLLFLNFDWRGLIGSLVVLLGGYWALLTFVPVPGVGVGSYAPDANLANWIDLHYLPGRLWDETRDPEGLLSTIPAIGTCVLGVLTGLLLKNDRLRPADKSVYLILSGVLMVAVGYLWSLQFPIVKAIWTSSFALVAGGYSAIMLGILHQIVDVWEWKAWATGFLWLGANAITIYFINGVFGFEPFALRFVGGDVSRWLDRMVTPGTGLFVAHLLGLAFAIALAGYLYKKKIFLRV